MKHKIIYCLALMCALVLSNPMAAGAAPRKDIHRISVVDEKGNPVEGGVIKGEDILTFTDNRGEGYISIAGNRSQISISAPGFRTLEVKVSKDDKSLRVILPFVDECGPDGKLLNDGFCEKSRESWNAPMSTLDMAGQMKFDTANDVADYINGLMPGLRTGINNRGLGTPLYVVDGMPSRDISLLSPTEIRSITFMQDANALAIYGVDGMNGVIFIKTKRGEEHRNQINLTANYGLRFAYGKPEFLGAAEYMTLYNEARMNDGLESMYSREVIEATARGDNPYKYPDVDLYSSDFLKKVTNGADVALEFNGGSKNLKYYVNMNYGYTGTIERFNESEDKGRHDISVRSNLDFRINKWISSSIDVSLDIVRDRNARTSVLEHAMNFRPNLFAPIIPVEYMSDELLNSEKMQTVNLHNGYIIGGSQAYRDQDAFAKMIAGGYSKINDTNTQVGNTFNFDLSGITSGLFLKTFFSFDYYDRYNVNFNNKFNYYEPVWSGNEVVDLVALGEADAKADVETVSVRSFTMRYGGYIHLGYDRLFADAHHVNAGFYARAFATKVPNVKQTDINSNYAFDLSYDFKRRYFVNMTGSLLHSIKLAPDHRNYFAHSVSGGWVMSNESFLKNSGAVDFLKLYASYSNLASDINIENYMLYQDIYNVNGGDYYWNDGMHLPQTIVTNGRNYKLGYITKKDITVGVDARLFRSLNVGVAYFRTLRGDYVKRNGTNFPSFYENFTPYYNSGEDKFEGMQLNMGYDRRFGDFSVNAGVNFTYMKGKIQSVDELPVEYPYLSNVGAPVGAIRGLRAEGFYQAADFDAEGNLREGLPSSGFGDLHPGDIRYADTNGDGVVDIKDESVIGESVCSYSLSLNLLLKYRNFSLFVLGRGAFGGEGIMNHGTYHWVDGNDKYSTMVRGRWTEQTVETATYPRLTTGTSSHNFRNSTHWLYDKSYFDIARVQLTYTLPTRFCARLGLHSVAVSVTGTNLLRFAPNKKILDTNLSGNLNYRCLMFGLNIGL